MGSYDVFMADYILLFYTDPCEVKFLGNVDFSRNTRNNQRLFTFKRLQRWLNTYGKSENLLTFKS